MSRRMVLLLAVVLALTLAACQPLTRGGKETGQRGTGQDRGTKALDVPDGEAGPSTDTAPKVERKGRTAKTGGTGERPALNVEVTAPQPPDEPATTKGSEPVPAAGQDPAGKEAPTETSGSAPTTTPRSGVRKAPAPTVGSAPATSPPKAPVSKSPAPTVGSAPATSPPKAAVSKSPAPTVGSAPATTPPSPSGQAPSTTGATTPPPPANPGGGLLPVYTPIAGCSEGNTVPRGQGPGAVNFEPLGSIWCFNLSDPPARTAAEGSNSWVDDFTVNTLMLSLDDREMGYRVFDNTGAAAGKSQHWINQNHWMTDVRDGFTGGSSIRPDRAFKFQNGKFVVEGDFAASIPEYGGETWGEITITSAPQPTGVIADNLYAYGQFGGHWTVGCRLQSDRVPTCAVEGPQKNSPPNSGMCSAIPGNYRVSEMSYFQNCGSQTMGGEPGGQRGQYWRTCRRGGPDMECRDRFRLEVTKSSLTLYVNGHKYFEDAGWPAAHQLPDSFINGDVYAYQSNWQVRAGSHAFRYHWDHFAVNPPNGPTASEWFN